MPLELLAPLVLVGLAIIIGAVHLSGGSQKGEPLTIESATDRFSVDFPNFSPTSVIVDDLSSVAFLVSIPSNEVGLVKQMGQHHLTRLLQPGGCSIREIRPNQIEVHLPDLSLSKILFTLSDAKKQTELMQSLNMMKRSR